jgi:ankyrin repeat protein
MAKAQTIERGHQIRVMPTPEEERRNRVLLGIGAAVLVVVGLIFLRSSSQEALNEAARRGDARTVQETLGLNLLLLDSRASLEIAINAGKGNVVRTLLSKGLMKPVDGLEAASKAGKSDILRLLMESGANVRGKKGGELLTRAAQSGDKETVQLLLHYGADKNATNHPDDGMTPLMYAAHSGKAGVVKVLLDAKANPNIRSKSGRTALMVAAAWNEPTACKFLIDAGAKVNDTDTKGQTALMSAAAVGNYATLDYLLSRGASVKFRDKAGKSSLDHAVEVGDSRTANRLRRAGANSARATRVAKR